MNHINIGPRDLEAILAVARSGSFRAAASDMGLSQPAVSMRIRHAEDVLGVKLFNRTTRSVTMTRHGERLALRAEQAMSDLRTLAQEFKDESRLKRGCVVMGASPAITGALLPQILHQFRQRWPGIEVIYRDEFLTRALDSVNRGDFDFFITPEVESDDRFHWEALMREEFFLVAPKGHPLVKARSTLLADVAQHPLITMPAGTRTRELLATAYRQAGFTFQPPFETRQMVSLIAMVKAGLGVAFMSESLLPLFNMDGLETAILKDVDLRRTVSIVRARGKAIQPATEVLLDAIRDGMRTAKPAVRRAGRR